MGTNPKRRALRGVFPLPRPFLTLDFSSEGDLRRAWRRGDHTAFSALVVRFEAALLRHARAAPRNGRTFRIALEAAPSRFHPDPDVVLLRVTLRGRSVATAERKPLALTLVIDSSGSMGDHGRIELVQGALRLLLRELSSTDAVALVSFGTEARVLVPMTSWNSWLTEETVSITLGLPKSSTRGAAG